MSSSLQAAFGAWYALADATSQLGDAIGQPGVFQVRRAEGLIDYPLGKSAMTYYGVALDVAAAVAAYDRALADDGRARAARWCRHQLATPAGGLAEATALHQRLLSQFIQRFGAPPRDQ